jgi:hypothetical protein
MPPGGCGVSNVREPSYTAMISTPAQFRDFVRCQPGSTAPFDFSREWLAVFSFSSEGGNATPLKVHDDGKTLTLVVDLQQYCGGMRPKRITHQFMYRVPAAPRRLTTNFVPKAQPPCPPNLP